MPYEDVWGSGGIVHLFLISALDGGEWSLSHPGWFTNGEMAPGTYWIGVWVTHFSSFIKMLNNGEKARYGQPLKGRLDKKKFR
jgi:hypothetical protein